MAVFTPSFLDRCDLDMKQLADASRLLSSAGPLIRLGDDWLPRVRDAFQTLSEYTRLPPGRFANKAVAAVLFRCWCSRWPDCRRRRPPPQHRNRMMRWLSVS